MLRAALVVCLLALPFVSANAPRTKAEEYGPENYLAAPCNVDDPFPYVIPPYNHCFDVQDGETSAVIGVDDANPLPVGAYVATYDVRGRPIAEYQLCEEGTIPLDGVAMVDVWPSPVSDACPVPFMPPTTGTITVTFL